MSDKEPNTGTPAADAPAADPPAGAGAGRFPVFEAPFLRAPEGARTVFLVTLAAACGPGLAGVVLFGWHAAIVIAISVSSCVVIERLYYRVSRVPALLGRSHAYLTGLLLALTLPAFVPWYIPLVASAFAIIVGKAVFGGVGHFLWQPALVGRLAVAVMFPTTMTLPFPDHPGTWPILAQNKLLVGELVSARRPVRYRQWRGRAAPDGADAFLLKPPSDVLVGLTSSPEPAFSSLAVYRETGMKPAALRRLPPLSDFLCGARPGGIGETCAVIIVVAGLYLIYRNYVKWHLPVSFLAAAVCVLAAAPVRLAGPGQTTETVWWPFLAEGPDVGFIYLMYQMLTGGLLLAAFFLATEMTSRPVTAGGQVVFGVGCGAIAMLLQLYVNVPIPCYMAVLAMNTLTPTIEAMWRPRVLGRRRFSISNFRFSISN